MTRLLYLWIALMLVLISVRDIRDYIIPDRYVLGIALCAVVRAAAGAFGPGRAPAEPGGGAVLTAALIWAVYLAALAVGAACGGPIPFGMGDVKLLSAIALALGREAFLFTFGGASILCGLCAAVLLAFGVKEKKDRIAFGPFIAVSCIAYLLSTSAM